MPFSRSLLRKRRGRPTGFSLPERGHDDKNDQDNDEKDNGQETRMHDNLAE